jgi:hypothetical protein
MGETSNNPMSKIALTVENLKPMNMAHQIIITLKLNNTFLRI